jgi:ribosome-binding ATPase YchF (GTP1/OBG family)
MDIAQLEDEADRELFMAEYELSELSVERIIRQSYEVLGRMNFFTVIQDEVRAWEVNRGATALECAGAIHSDMARGFIRAEVVSFNDLMTAGSQATAKTMGKVRLEGKDHLIHDGDIVAIRFNV